MCADLSRRNMSHSPLVMKYDNLSSVSNTENRYKSRLSIALTLIMFLSVIAPSLSPSIDNLDKEQEIQYTANGTLDDTSTSTLLSNLNASNPIEVIGVMDDSQRVHLVWIENGTNPQLYFALISTSGIDTVLIDATAVGNNSTTALSSPSLVIDSNYRTCLLYTSPSPRDA